MALVLASAGIAHQVVEGGGAFALLVDPRDLAAGTSALAAFDAESVPAVVPPAPDLGPSSLGIVAAAVLLAMFVVAGAREAAHPSVWFTVGSASAEDIRDFDDMVRRASQIAGLHDVPIVPVEVSDSDALEIAIIENVQRENLNAMEEAQGYHALANEFKRSQDEIAKTVGKSRSHVANMMRLTKLPAEVQAYIAAGQLSAGHARALIGVPDPLAAAKRIVEEGLNVRQTEALAHEEGVPERKPQKPRAGASGVKTKDADTVALEKRVSDALGLAVSVNHRDPGGSVQITYKSLEQLDEVMRRLARSS